jgi:hypothetical protein
MNVESPGLANIHLFHVREQERIGVGRRTLARHAERGLLTRIRPGVYARAEDWAAIPWWERYRVHIEAVNRYASRTRVFTLQSAAALWGIPYFGMNNDVHVLADDGSNPRLRAGIRTHRDKHLDTLQFHQGSWLTSRAQTVVELAATIPFEQAVAACDHVLCPDNAQGLPGVKKDKLLQVAARLGIKAKIQRVEQVVQFADARAESAGESLSRAYMYMLGYPQPELQYPVFAADGSLIGISDFYWKDQGILGEFDGSDKYSRNEYLKGRLPQEALMAEKMREDAMRSTGCGMVRWLWSDIWQNRKAAAAGLDQKLRHAGFIPGRTGQGWE